MGRPAAALLSRIAREEDHEGEPAISDVLPTGLHHVTAIASDPQANVDFYTRVLGLRLVKRTVNFDAPGTYHLYYGDELGRPSTLLTFFPWPKMPPHILQPWPPQYGQAPSIPVWPSYVDPP